jgi:GNAT superfamily N-acetyltransferase
MANYTVRRASMADAEMLIRHRVRMFVEMGVMTEADPREPALAVSFKAWLDEQMAASTYVAWVVDLHENGQSSIVAGGGATIIPWPPGPHYPGSRIAYVYNVYTEPPHRGHGLARLVMAAVHAFCRNEGIHSLALNASTFGQPLYESLGYRVTPSPMMFLSLG